MDGRLFPWGDFLDASWVCMRASAPSRPMPRVVDTFPVDTSVYGVRGLGGNVHDWTADAFLRPGPHIAGDRVLEPRSDAIDASAPRVLRGGCWSGAARVSRSACRGQAPPRYRLDFAGFRVARTAWGGVTDR